jgi:hypothetical protein
MRGKTRSPESHGDGFGRVRRAGDGAWAGEAVRRRHPPSVITRLPNSVGEWDSRAATGSTWPGQPLVAFGAAVDKGQGSTKSRLRSGTHGAGCRRKAR